MKKLMKRIILSLSLTVMALGANAFAGEKSGVSLSGNVGVVSSYQFRGLEVDGPAVQGFMNFEFAAIPGLTVGTWLSSISKLGHGAGVTTDSSGDAGTETDYIISYAGGDDSFSWSVGWIGYSYDFYRFGSNDDGDIAMEQEYNFGIGFAGVSLAYYLVPAQDSTKGTNNSADANSFSWLDIGYGMDVSNFSIGAIYSAGDYTTRGTSTTASESISTGTINISKSINKETSVSFNRILIIGNDEASSFRNQFWFGIDSTF